MMMPKPAVVPVLLDGGIPLLPAPSVRMRLALTGHRVYTSGIVLLEYAVRPAAPSPGASSGDRRRGTGAE